MFAQFLHRQRAKNPTRMMEKGFGRAASGTFSEAEGVQSGHTYVESADDKLTMFRMMTGIISSPTMASASIFSSAGRPAPNLGIYARVVHNEHTAKRGYKNMSFLINGCLGVQIVVAAALTAMGAAGTGRSLITVFGAINTVIAGILTFLKGSGLPNRMKYYQKEWKRVREFIEQRERDFSRPNDLDVHEVMRVIERMYSETDMETEANTPDRYASLNGSAKQPPPMLTVPPKIMQFASSHNLDEKIHGAQSQARDHAGGLLGGLHNLEARVGTTIKDLGQMAHGAEVQAKNALSGFKHHEDAIEQTRRDVMETKDRAYSGFHDARTSANARYDDARTGVETRYDDAKLDAQGRYDDAKTSAYRSFDDTKDKAYEIPDRLRGDLQARVEKPLQEVRGLAEEMEYKAKDALRTVMKHEETLVEHANQDLERATETMRPRNMAGAAVKTALDKI